MTFRPTHFRPHETGARRALGDLEAEIMECMWNSETATVRDVHARLSDRSLAYTTVMTVMSRLAAKGLLSKDKEGKQYVYTAALSRRQFEERIADSLLSGLTGGLGAAAIASFVESVEDDEVLKELEDLIREKRKHS